MDAPLRLAHHTIDEWCIAMAERLRGLRRTRKNEDGNEIEIPGTAVSEEYVLMYVERLRRRYALS